MEVDYIIFITFFAIFATYMWQWYRRRSGLPPGPWGWPVVGNALQIDPNAPHLTLDKWAKQYGDLYTINLMGKYVVVPSSAASIQVSLSSKY